MTAYLERIIFGHRRAWLAAWLVLTLLAAVAASALRLDASFVKQVPLEHPYIQTLLRYESQVAGPNRITIDLAARKGNIYDPAYLESLRKLSEEVFFLPGVNRTTLRSLWSPNVRYTISVEGGLEANPVIPPEYKPDENGAALVRRNVLRADLVGSLVARDASSSLVIAELRDVDPSTGKPVDYVDVARQLEQLRAKYTTDATEVHIIGYVPLVGAIVAGGQAVLAFFAISVLITALLIRRYAGAWLPTMLLLVTSVSTVIWQLGLTALLGTGMNPLSAIVPFLVFAISVSHGIQVVNMQLAGLAQGLSPQESAQRAFAQLWAPGIAALAANVVGFATLWLIPIGVIRDIALMSTVGVAAVSVCKLTALPLLLTYVRHAPRAVGGGKGSWSEVFWRLLGYAARPRVASVLVLAGVALGAYAFHVGQHRIIGDTQAGASELKPNSVYNRDVSAIVSHYDLSSDVLVVVATGRNDSCLDYEAMRMLDRFGLRMSETEGVRSVLSLASVVKNINSAWAEGNPKHFALQRGDGLLALSVDYVPPGSGLRSLDCTTMPVYVFASDHKAQTIERLVGAVKQFAAEHPDSPLKFQLAAGPLGVEAAVNESVVAAQLPMLVGVFVSVAVVSFLGLRRSWRATLVVLLPLLLVTALADALMVWLDIGLKVATLPVAALGVGIGVDYGVYIFSRFQQAQAQGLGFHEAYMTALRQTGRAVMFTGATLSISVATWVFSPLRYQHDIGITLTAMFVMSMLGAVVLSPAIARLLYAGGAGRARPAGDQPAPVAAADASVPPMQNKLATPT